MSAQIYDMIQNDNDSAEGNRCQKQTFREPIQKRARTQRRN